MPSLPGLVCVDDKVGFSDGRHMHTSMGHVQAGGSCAEASGLLGSQQVLHGYLSAVPGHTLTSVGLVRYVASLQMTSPTWLTTRKRRRLPGVADPRRCDACGALEL